jgi:endonuclease G, mitochondrial
MTSPFFRRFVPAVLLLLALTIGPLLSSVTSQVSVSVHIPFGNVSGATSSSTSNRLVTRSQFALSWNASKRTANWVAWRLRASDIGSTPRSDFHVDPQIPTPSPSDYTNSGYDRGHLCPSGDRTNNATNNYAVFSMINIIPQAPDNNQGPWERLESYTRSLAQAGREVYIIAGGVGSKGSFNNITIPASTWKIIVALQPGRTYPSTSGSTTIAVLMPNNQGIRSNSWQTYQTTVSNIQSRTGYNFSNYPQ